MNNETQVHCYHCGREILGKRFQVNLTVIEDWPGGRSVRRANVEEVTLCPQCCRPLTDNVKALGKSQL
jgi:hypothetical protein